MLVGPKCNADIWHNNFQVGMLGIIVSINFCLYQLNIIALFNILFIREMQFYFLIVMYCWKK